MPIHFLIPRDTEERIAAGFVGCLPATWVPRESNPALTR